MNATAAVLRITIKSIINTVLGPFALQGYSAQEIILSHKPKEWIRHRNWSLEEIYSIRDVNDIVHFPVVINIYARYKYIIFLRVRSLSKCFHKKNIWIFIATHIPKNFWENVNVTWSMIPSKHVIQKSFENYTVRKQ